MFAIKTRVIITLLATLMVTFLAPISTAVANGAPDETISISAIEGVTPPVAGATPVQFITPNDEYTGEVFWSNIVGDLDEADTFTSLTHYKAEILIIPKSGFTLDESDENFFTVADSTNVETDYFEEDGIFKGVVTAYFIPEAGDATPYLDEDFGTNGSFSIKDFFGVAPLNDSNTAVGPLKVDRIAVDSQDRIVVLASFYTVDNQILGVADALGDDIGTGYQNTESIAMQQGNVRESSAAVAARTYRPTVANVQVTDWYLPSIGELWALKETAAAVNTVLDHYWSSTESDTNTALYIDFYNFGGSSATKSNYKAVRPIRSGTLADASVGATGPGGGKIFYVMQGDTFSCGPTLSSTCNYLEAAPNGWSGEVGDPFISWATGPIDNHILFRLNADGSYDNSFGVGGPSLRKVVGDTPKSHVLVTTTGRCYSFSEKVDLEIDSEDKLLVLLSGSDVEGECFGNYHNFVARYNSDGTIDTTFSEDGVIGSLEPRSGPFPESLFANVTVDALGRITVASLGYDADFDFLVQRFTPVGVLDVTFGPDNSPGSVFAEITYPEGDQPSEYRSIQIIADGDSGYMIAFTGSVEMSNNFNNNEDVIFTQLIRFLENGMLDQGFALPPPPSSDPDDPRSPFILPNFAVTDIAADGPTGFIISGTYSLGENMAGLPSLFGLMARAKFNGDTDTEFSPLVDDPRLSPAISNNCLNTALLRNRGSNQSMIGVVVGDYCGTRSLKAFAPSGSFQGELSLGVTPIDLGLQSITQLESTSTGKLLVLTGTQAATGLIGYAITTGNFENFSSDWTNATITRYQLPGSLITPPSEPPAPTPPVVVYVAPTPVPYLKTLTTPKLNLKDDKLMCTPGTYNAGYTLDGVVQGSATTLFTPNTLTYNLLINGIAQTSLAVTSTTSSHSWSMPTASAGALLTCSVTVTANGLTNTDRSSDTPATISTALSTQTAAIAIANATYSASLATNTKAYQKALIDNRANWRNETAKIRTDYYAERERIRALPSTKATRALSSAALKTMSAAQKKSAADYKASQPAALAAKDAADKAALDAKTAAIARANTAYGTFIESIGYGVLIP